MTVPWNTARPFAGMPRQLLSDNLMQEAVRFRDHPLMLFRTPLNDVSFSTRAGLALLKTLVLSQHIVRFLLLESPGVQGMELPPVVPLDPSWASLADVFAERCERWKSDLAGVPNCCEIIVRDFLEETRDWMPGDLPPLPPRAHLNAVAEQSTDYLPPETEPRHPRDYELPHSPDFRSIGSGSSARTLAPLQAAAAKLLCEADCPLAQDFVLTEIESDSDRLQDLFKGRNADLFGAGRLIEPTDKGFVRFNKLFRL